LDVSRGKQPEPGRVSVVLRERIEDEQPQEDDDEEEE
jgi:hypothetical protein